MATYSSVLAWRIPGTGEPGGLLSMGLHRVGHDWSDFAAAVGGTTWCFGIYCEMINTVWLADTSITSHNYKFFCVSVVRTSTLKLSNTVLLMAVTILCYVPRTYSSYNWKLVFFDHHLYIYLHTQPLITTILLFDFLRVYIYVRSYNICLSLIYFT